MGQLKYTSEKIGEDFKKLGATLLTEDPISYTTEIEFICSNPDCNNIGYTTCKKFYGDGSKTLLCDSCKPHRGCRQLPSDFIKEAVESTGAKFIEERKVDKHHTNIIFGCSKCGNTYYIDKAAFRKGINKNLLCPDCNHFAKGKDNRAKKEFRSFEDYKMIFSERGAELLDQEISSTSQKVKFICSVEGCQNIGEVKLSNVLSGNTKLLRCSIHNPNKMSVEQKYKAIKDKVESTGAKLLNTSYKNNREVLYFECSKCGEIYYISANNFLKGVNKNLLCEKCYKGKQYNPTGKVGSGRSYIMGYWYAMLLDFFNIPRDKQEAYSSHHIRLQSIYEDEKYSLFNGYPVLKEKHGGEFDFYLHKDPESDNICNWPDSLFLYNSKKVDLGSKIVSDIIDTSEDVNFSVLKNKKENFWKEGKLYIPFYVEETFAEYSKEIIYSMLRIRALKYNPEIFEFTGLKLHKVYARQCKISLISHDEAKEFFTKSHIQGFIPASIYIGLKYKGEIVEAVSLGKPRSGSYEWEIYRLSTKINSIVVGGSEKLIKYFIKTYSPKNILTFCDLRFASLDPKETVYHRLGFNFLGKTDPGYKYADNDNRLFSRQLFQKGVLHKKLINFDPNLSESKNMELAGYHKIHDCGNFKFLWTNN